MAGDYVSSSTTCLRMGSISANDHKRQAQRHLPHRLCQWKHGRRLIDGIDRLDGLGFLTSLLLSDSHSLLGYYLNVFGWL